MCLQTGSLFLGRNSCRLVRIGMIICIFIPLSLTCMESGTKCDHILHAFLEICCLLRLTSILRVLIV